MTLQYDVQLPGFSEDTNPENVVANYHRTISGGTLYLSVKFNFSNDGDTQDDSAYLGWIEDITDALATAGWTLENLGQYGPQLATRTISTV